MVTDKATILASIAANGLTQIGVNKWHDDKNFYSIRKNGNGFILKCTRFVPWRGMEIEMREALRPMFLAARSDGRV